MDPDQEPAEQAARSELCVQDSDTEAWVGAVTDFPEDTQQDTGRGRGTLGFPSPVLGALRRAWASVFATSVLGFLLVEGLQAARVPSLFHGLWLVRGFSRDSVGSFRSSLHLLLQVPFEEAKLQEDKTGVSTKSMEHSGPVGLGKT